MRMNTINKLTLGLVLMAGFASCEMKDELLGKKGEFGDVGFLSLDIATSTAGNTVTTKGTTDQIDDFPVIITGTNVDTTLNFASFAELKEVLPIELPVGTYTIEAHSPGEYANEMSEPYYGGTKSATITKDVSETQTTVTCSIQNVKITINYTAAFLNTYNSWEITVNDGKTNGRTKTYSNTDSDASSPTPVYWKLDEGTEAIYVNGYAIHGTSGERITIAETIYKRNTVAGEDNPEGGDANYFIGGDELVIGFNPTTVEGSTPGVEKNGIEITVSGFNAEMNETIEIEVDGTGDSGDSGDDEPENPGEGDSSAITISDNGTGYLTNGVTVSGSEYPDDVKVSISVPTDENSDNGIQSVFVKITSTNSEFTGEMTKEGSLLKDLIEGEKGLDLASEDAPQELSSLFPLPTKGEDNYEFSMSSSLFMMLSMFKGTHNFQLTVIDIDGNEASATLTITMN